MLKVTYNWSVYEGNCLMANGSICGNLIGVSLKACSDAIRAHGKTVEWVFNGETYYIEYIA